MRHSIVFKPILVGLSFLSISSMAAPGKQDTMTEQQHLQNSVMLLRDQLGALRAQKITRSCEKEHQHIWAGSEVKISWFYGYENHENKTYDRITSTALVRVLKQPCKPNDTVQACGFRQVSRVGHMTRLEKVVHGKAVKLNIYFSSLTNEESQNADVEKKYWEQQERSRQVQRQFAHDLRHSDIVFYSGHSRGGAGPGFESQSAAQIGFNYLFRGPWRSNLRALQAPSNLKVFALFSCSSSKYYRKDIESVNPNISMILSHKEVSSDEAEQAGIGALNAFLTKACASDVHNSMISNEEGDERAMEYVLRR